MGTRIATIQRQARELGRLRTGTYNGSRPVRSKTWVISSHAEHYVQAAAEIWGGTPEKWQPQGNGAAQWRVVTDAPALDAILPPGDPLSQSYESWSRGGCQRRCDGMTESLSDEPCLCRAKWGDSFWESAPKDMACKVTTRLNVILPEMPDIGAWRVETHSYYSANEMAAAVDVMKGSIGDAALIPIRLRIEQRTRVAAGKTKQFPVVAVELRGSTAGQLLAGAVPGMKAVAANERPAVEQPERTAIEAPAEDRPDVFAAIQAAETRDQVVELWQQAKANGDPRAAQIEAAAKARVQQILDQVTDEAGEGGSSMAPPPDTDALWAQIVAAWPGDRTDEIEDAFAKASAGEHPSTATAEQLHDFLQRVQDGRIKPATTDAVPF